MFQWTLDSKELKMCLMDILFCPKWWPGYVQVDYRREKKILTSIKKYISLRRGSSSFCLFVLVCLFVCFLLFMPKLKHLAEIENQLWDPYHTCFFYP